MLWPLTRLASRQAIFGGETVEILIAAEVRELCGWSQQGIVSDNMCADSVCGGGGWQW